MVLPNRIPALKNFPSFHCLTKLRVSKADCNSVTSYKACSTVPDGDVVSGLSAGDEVDGLSAGDVVAGLSAGLNAGLVCPKTGATA